MRSNQFDRPPRGLTRRGTKLDNVVLVPASLLPFSAEWQAIASKLPRGDVLIVLPSQAKQQRVARFVASHLTGKGKRVLLVNRQLQENTVRLHLTSPSL